MPNLFKIESKGFFPQKLMARHQTVNFNSQRLDTVRIAREVSQAFEKGFAASPEIGSRCRNRKIDQEQRRHQQCRADRTQDDADRTQDDNARWTRQSMSSKLRACVHRAGGFSPVPRPRRDRRRNGGLP
jgi:hypothetical protein